eukprot:1141947-Pelagomonas_calceolata.AAC.1
MSSSGRPWLLTVGACGAVVCREALSDSFDRSRFSESMLMTAMLASSCSTQLHCSNPFYVLMVLACILSFYPWGSQVPVGIQEHSVKKDTFAILRLCGRIADFQNTQGVAAPLGFQLPIQPNISAFLHHSQFVALAQARVARQMAPFASCVCPASHCAWQQSHWNLHCFAPPLLLRPAHQGMDEHLDAARGLPGSQCGFGSKCWPGQWE